MWRQEFPICNIQSLTENEILLGSYYKYGTYKCYRPIFLEGSAVIKINSTIHIFWDWMVLIIVKYLKKSEQYV